MGANPQESELFVCLSDGRIAVLDIRHDKLMEGQVIYQTTLPGSIVSLYYKFSDWSEFINRKDD